MSEQIRSDIENEANLKKRAERVGSYGLHKTSHYYAASIEIVQLFTHIFVLLLKMEMI